MQLYLFKHIFDHRCQGLFDECGFFFYKCGKFWKMFFPYYKSFVKYWLALSPFYDFFSEFAFVSLLSKIRLFINFFTNTLNNLDLTCRSICFWDVETWSRIISIHTYITNKLNEPIVTLLNALFNCQHYFVSIVKIELRELF